MHVQSTEGLPVICTHVHMYIYIHEERLGNIFREP